MTLFLETIQQAIGLDTFSYAALMHMAIRGFYIYFLGLILIRFNKKLFGTRTSFNFILFVMLGSIFANAIVDQKLFLTICGTVLFLTGLNNAISMLAFYFKPVERLLKGSHSILMIKGEIQWDAMRKNFITELELVDELQAQLHTRNIAAVDSAQLSSNGTINFTLK